MRVYVVLYLAIVVLIPLALSQASNFGGKPSYVLEIRSNNPELNPGENFTFELYVSGAGNLTDNKLSVDIPVFVEKNGSVNYKYIDWYPNSTSYLIYNPNNSYHYPGFNINLPRAYFEEDNKTPLMNLGEEYNNNTPGLHGPIAVNFTVNTTSPSGDYNIYTNLFYKYDGQWYADEQSLPLHIKYWYEDESIQRLVIGAAIVAILSGIVIIIEFCIRIYLNYRKIQINK